MEEVTVLAIGDPHFKVSNVKETTAMTTAILSIARDKRPTFIVVLGDILDRHETIHVSPLSQAINFLRDLSTISKVYALIGNHDLKNNRQYLSDEHPFKACKMWCNDSLVVVDKVIQQIIGCYLFTFLPYVPPGRFIEALNTYPGWESSTCIFAHQELYGCKMESITSTEGDKWPTTYPSIISGHIHEYQEPQSNILYVGTPIQHNFKEKDNIEHNTVSFFKFSSSGRTHERISLNIPRKLVIRLNYNEVPLYHPQPGHELKIIIMGTAGELKTIMKHPNIELWRKNGYKISCNTIPLAMTNIPSITNTGGNVKYSTRLYNTIKDKPHILEVYQEIFQSI